MQGTAYHALTGVITHRVCLKRQTHCLGIMESLRSVTPALCALTDTPSASILREVLPTIERYVVVLYDRGSSEDDVNRAKQVLFTQKGREIEKIPPKQDALMQHLHRVGYQAGHVWGQALLKAPYLPSPADFGWTRKGDVPEWEVQWMTLPPAGTTCRGPSRVSARKAEEDSVGV